MNQLEDLSDEEILNRVIAGEKFYYEGIIRKYNPYLYKVGRTYNYSHEDTQDLMQDTFVDAYKNLSNFEKRSSFKTWIVRIMLNNCYHKSRKSSFIKETNQDLEENAKPMFSQSENNTDKIIHQHELKHVIEDALSRIPEKYRMVFSLREMNGFNVAETAKLLHITKGNVKVRLNRSKAILRNEIEKNYTLEELFDFNLIYCDAIVKNVMKRIKVL
ncbi:MAG TPA: sigma-70 family RNA polymerase sigma factor [Chitinophagaceae bacterium]|nr:sigma-70 family RNA polymerase sigma factor [Chitinophagaceae bacterium]